MKKIVLIDDDIGIQETTVDILELAGYNVFTSNNGKEGIKQIKQVEPDVILCDINMPELDGYEVLRILNRMPVTASIPFIFLSSKIENSEIRKGMNLGADDYITKPFKEIDLLDAIEIRIKRSKKLNQKFEPKIDDINSFIDIAHEINSLDGIYKTKTRRTFAKNEIIFREQDIVNSVYFIISGKVKRIETDSYGKEFLNDIHCEGDFFGYLNLFFGKDNKHKRTAIALEPTEVALIPKKDFQTLINQDRNVAYTFIKILSGNVLDKEQRLLQLAYASVRERVAGILVKFLEDEKAKKKDVNLLKISRDDLANIVGTSKETLIRTLSDFKKEGIIKTDRAEIFIKNEKALRKIIEFS